jgi:hypothetical protein
VCRRRALDAWLNAPAIDQALSTQLFALPVLLISGGATGTINGVLHDAGVLTSVMQKNKALGPLEQFALGNTLADVSSLTGASLLRLRRYAQFDTAAVRLERPDVPPAPIEIDTKEEAVHLRFLIGVAVSMPQSPAVTETAGQIGAWGMEFSRELSAQIGLQGMSLLAIPRPPATLLRARHRGHFAREESRLTLELSRALRSFRASVGEPSVTIASCGDATIRLVLTSPFDSQFDQQLSWALHPLDEMDHIERSIEALLADCRVEDVNWIDTAQDVTLA